MEGQLAEGIFCHNVWFAAVDRKPEQIPCPHTWERPQNVPTQRLWIKLYCQLGQHIGSGLQSCLMVCSSTGVGQPIKEGVSATDWVLMRCVMQLQCGGTASEGGWLAATLPLLGNSSAVPSSQVACSFLVATPEGQLTEGGALLLLLCSFWTSCCKQLVEGFSEEKAGLLLHEYDQNCHAAPLWTCIQQRVMACYPFGDLSVLECMLRRHLDQDLVLCSSIVEGQPAEEGAAACALHSLTDGMPAQQYKSLLCSGTGVLPALVKTLESRSTAVEYATSRALINLAKVPGNQQEIVNALLNQMLVSHDNHWLFGIDMGGLVQSSKEPRRNGENVIGAITTICWLCSPPPPQLLHAHHLGMHLLA